MLAEAKLVASLARPKETPCLCGGRAMIEKRFKSGHDSQLLGRLKAPLAGDDDAAKREARNAISTLVVSVNVWGVGYRLVATA